jgi:hypothetical protein
MPRSAGTPAPAALVEAWTGKANEDFNTERRPFQKTSYLLLRGPSQSRVRRPTIDLLCEAKDAGLKAAGEHAGVRQGDGALIVVEALSGRSPVYRSHQETLQRNGLVSWQKAGFSW